MANSTCSSTSSGSAVVVASSIAARGTDNSVPVVARAISSPKSTYIDMLGTYLSVWCPFGVPISDQSAMQSDGEPASALRDTGHAC
jgi:hypothetical protein